MKEICDGRGLAYAVSSDLVSFRHAGVILGSVATANARVGESIGLIRAECRRTREEGSTGGELDDAKIYMIGAFSAQPRYERPFSFAARPNAGR
jgi:zinc protease